MGGGKAHHPLPGRLAHLDRQGHVTGAEQLTVSVLGRQQFGFELRGRDIDRHIADGVHLFSHRELDVKQGLVLGGLEVQQVTRSGGGFAIRLGGGAGLHARCGLDHLDLVQVDVAVLARHGQHQSALGCNADSDQIRAKSAVDGGLDQTDLICRAVQGTAVTHSAGRHGQFPGARHKLHLTQIGRCSRGSGGEVDGEGAAALFVGAKTDFGAGHIGVGLQGITDALRIHGGVARVGHLGRCPTAQLQGKAFAGLSLGDGEPLLLVGSGAQRQQGDRIGDLALAQGQFEAALGAHA